MLFKFVQIWHFCCRMFRGVTFSGQSVFSLRNAYFYSPEVDQRRNTRHRKKSE